MYVITIKLPDGKNYFCGIKKYGEILCPEWDTDKKYAKVFEKKLEADYVVERLQKLEGSRNAKIEIMNLLSKN